MVVLVRGVEEAFSSLKGLCAEMHRSQVLEEANRSNSSSSKYQFAGMESSDETIQHERFIGMPRQVLSMYREVHNASYMGILPEINRVWVTIDNRLYLWNYEQPDEVTEYEGLDDSDVIVSVALSAPKPGIFLENISYVLVVATLSEITLFAVTEGSCKILRTAYNTPCEGIVYKAVGSQCGRIFLAGSDGSISEFMYSTESRLSLWNINVALQSGRDACYLNKHGHWDSRMVRLAPSFLRLSNTPSHCADALADLAVDNMRHVLYCLSTGGQLCVCSLAGGHDHSVRRVGGNSAVYDVFTLARKWVDTQLGLHGDGGDTALRDGRSDNYKHDGGDDDANTNDEIDHRSLKYGRFSACFATSSSGAPLAAVGVHVVGVTDPSYGHHVVITSNNGTRICMHLTHRNGISYGGYGDMVPREATPVAIAVTAVLPPPAPGVQVGSSSSSSSSSSDPRQIEGGSLDGFVHRAYYGHGLSVMAYVGPRDSASSVIAVTKSYRNGSGDSRCSTTGTNSAGNGRGVVEEKSQEAGAKRAELAGVSLSDGEAEAGELIELINGVYGAFNGVLRDIKEDCSDMVQGRAPYVLELMRLTSSVSHDATSHRSYLTLEEVKSLSNALVSVAQPAPPQAISTTSLATETELIAQLCPAAIPNTTSGTSGEPVTGTVVRRLLALESQGLHVLIKRRPIDRVFTVMREILPLSQSSRHRSHNEGAVQSLLRDYGQEGFACMCVAIVCGTACPGESKGIAGEGARGVENAFRTQYLPTYLGQNTLLEGPQVQCERVSRHITTATFTASSFTRGVQLYLTHALCSVWHQPLLTCDREAPSLSPLWSEEVLSAVLAPTTALATFLEEYYPHATSATPFSEKDKTSLLSKHAQLVSEGATSSLSSSHVEETLLQAGHHENSLYTAHSVAKQLETSQLASLYRLVDKVRQVLQLLLLLVKRSQYLERRMRSLHKLGKKLVSKAEEAAMVSPRSLELSMSRDKVLRHAARVKRQAAALSSWRHLVPPAADGNSIGTTLHTVCTDIEHSAALKKELRTILCETRMVEEEAEAEEAEEGDDSSLGLDRSDLSGVSDTDIGAMAVGEGGLEDQRVGLFSSGPTQSAEALATQFYRHGFHYFSEADVHEYLAFQHLHHLICIRKRGSGHSEECHGELDRVVPKVARHLLSACPTWRDPEQVATSPLSTDSLLGEHCALLSELGSCEEALSLIVEICLATAKNFRGNPPLEVHEAAHEDGARADEHTYHTGINLSADQQREGCEACYTHLITSICVTAGISMEQRAGMLLLALQDPELGGDPCMLEIMCEGLRGRYTEELLLNLPTDYVGDFLRRRDRERLFEWFCRRGRQEQACGLMLELAYEDNGNPIAQRIQYLQQGLAVVPPGEYAVVERMLKFALIQSEAYIHVLTLSASEEAPAVFGRLSEEPGSSGSDGRGINSGVPGGDSGRHHYYHDASPSKQRDLMSSTSQHKAPRLSPGAGAVSEHTSDMHPGAHIRARDRERVLESARYRLGFTLVSEGEWCAECFHVVRDLHLWDVNLHLLSLLDLQQVPGADEALVIRLWKSYIYRLVPLHSKEGPRSQVGRFLSKQRHVTELDIDPSEHHAPSSSTFEDYERWLPALKESIQTLCTRLDDINDAAGEEPKSAKGQSSVPLAHLLSELENIAAELDIFSSGDDHQGSQHNTLRGWVADALMTVNIRPLHVVRAYVHVFWSAGRGFNPERIIKLLESLSYVLTEWLQEAIGDAAGARQDTHDLRSAVRSQELGNWMDTLRHQLSDMSGRALSVHHKDSLGRVHIEFQRLLRLVDDFSLH